MTAASEGPPATTQSLPEMSLGSVGVEQFAVEVVRTSKEQAMTKKQTKDPAGKKTSGGGHVGGTKSGQTADAKTTSTVDKKGDKVRPNDGRN